LVRQGLPIAAAACLVVMAGWLLERPANVQLAAQPQSAQVETVQPDQVDHALDAMHMLGEFSSRMPRDAADSKM
jgi:hypothetical protein